MKTDQIREKFLAFFEAQCGHTRLASDSLVPANDPSLLFTGAGMNQFKDEFQGKGRARDGLRRACTSQKCFRADDLDNVGITAAHHTFFEMLGNFSFGDYFKREAIDWAWHLLLEVFGFDRDRLRVSVYEEDDEAYGIWHDVAGVPADRIHRFGEHDNYWPADAPSKSPAGTLCGPCTEIFFDRGAAAGCGQPDCNPSCDCDRFVEIWNLVFQQYLKQADGTLEPLPTQNIDTGAGLERLAAVLQGVETDFETDVFAPIVAQIVGVTGRKPVPGTPDKVRIHRIADHVRGAVFCIGDGVLPGNKGRGYVLRRILRRASCDAHDMGVKEPFLYRLVPTIVEVMQGGYPELVERRENLARIIRAEEESFLATLGRGSAILQDRIQQVADSDAKALPGDVAAELWDTYGFPFEMTQQICAEQGLEVDQAAFEAAMDERQATSKAGGKFGDVFDTSALAQVKDFADATDFRGYDATEWQATVLAIVADDALVDEAAEGTDVTVVLDGTPFYGESGGQVGDSGAFETEDAHVAVHDTGRAGGYFHHHGTVTRGTLRKGDRAAAAVDADRRNAIRRNHTATHILQWALRKVLGEHVEQAGSYVAPDRLRFDFTHFSALEPREMARVEEIVNARILENAPVAAQETSLDEARAQGAMALFGEKYGDAVRMVSVGDFSRELCGGTHCGRTGDIGLFRIVSETGIAAGVRRIEAVTGRGAYERVVEEETLLGRLGEVLKAPRDRLVARAEELVAETKQLARDLEKAKRQSFAGAGADGPFQEKARIGDTVILAGALDGGNANDLRIAADQLRKQHPSAVILLGASSGGGAASLLCALTPDVVDKGLSAGNIVKVAAREIGGGGGGRPDMAQAGGKNPAGLQAALDLGVKLAEEGLK